MALLIIPGKERNHLTFNWTGDQGLEVCTVTYGPEIDQSQHAKPVGHKVNHFIIWLTDFHVL